MTNQDGYRHKLSGSHNNYVAIASNHCGFLN